MRRYLVLKAVGTTLIIGIFFVAYLHLLHYPPYPVTVMASTALDRLLPFQPQALFLYLSLWLYVGAGPGLQLRLAELVSYAAWSVMLCVAGLAIFHFWPTQVPASGLDLSRYFGFAMLQGIDAAGNACPSMHVAFASFTAVRIDRCCARSARPGSCGQETSPGHRRSCCRPWRSSNTSSSTSAQGWCSGPCSRRRRCAGDWRCRSCAVPPSRGRGQCRDRRCLNRLDRSAGGSGSGKADGRAAQFGIGAAF
jgi:hypothetical protein